MKPKHSVEFLDGGKSDDREYLSIEIADGKSAPPTEFRIFRAGANETLKGNFLFDAQAADAVMKASADWANEHFIDYGHAAMDVFTLDPAEAGKAAGWFKPELRNGDLWATNVRWTDKAAEKLKAREYRYMSPAFKAEGTRSDKQRRITELMNVALTNYPATKRLDPLVAHGREPGTPLNADPKESTAMLKNLIIALGLAADATEADVLAAIVKLKEGVSGLLVLSGKTSLAEAQGVLTAWKESAAKAVELAGKLATIEAAARTAEIDTLITAAVKDGKIAPGQVDFWKKQPSESLKGYLSVAIPLTGSERKPPAADGKGGSDVQLAAEDREVMSQLGITDPKKYLEAKAAAKPTLAP